MKINYRQPLSKSELASLFQLRHQVYSEDNEMNSMNSFDMTHDKNEFDMNDFDINPFDINAYHFGAYLKNIPIGYIRMTSSSPTNTSEWTKEIISENGINLITCLNDFPFEKYYPDEYLSKRLINSYSTKKIGEIGKLAIHGDYRNGGLVFENLISQFQLFCFYEQEYDLGIKVCSLEFEMHYKNFGFQRIDHSTTFSYKKVPEAVIIQFSKPL